MSHKFSMFCLLILKWFSIEKDERKFTISFKNWSAPLLYSKYPSESNNSMLNPIANARALSNNWIAFALCIKKILAKALHIKWRFLIILLFTYSRVESACRRCSDFILNHIISLNFKFLLILLCFEWNWGGGVCNVACDRHTNSALLSIIVHLISKLLMGDIE